MLEKKYNKLKQLLSSTGKCAIAVSGGLDSMFLALTAKEVLGNHFLAINIATNYMHNSEREEMESIFRKHKVPFQIIDLEIPQDILVNPENRCYLCKTELFTKTKKFALELGYEKIMDGTNADDMHAHRPGMKALAELKVLSPLKEAGITKKEIRELSEKFGYSFHDKDSNSCLLTRLPYNYPINKEEIRAVELAEEHLFQKGFRSIRVRSDKFNCSIEVAPKQVKKLQKYMTETNTMKYFINLGFKSVTVDPEGYISGKRI